MEAKTWCLTMFCLENGRKRGEKPRFLKAWFTSAAVTGRAIAAAALLGVLDGCGASFDFFVAQSCGDTATRWALAALERPFRGPLRARLQGI